MFSFKGTGPAQPSDGGAGHDLAALLQRSHLAVFVSLILLTIGAWGLTIIQAQSMQEMGVVVAPVTSDGQEDERDKERELTSLQQHGQVGSRAAVSRLGDSCPLE